MIEFRHQDYRAAARSLRSSAASLATGGALGGSWPDAEAEIYHHLCNYEMHAGESAASTTCREAIGKMRRFLVRVPRTDAERHDRAVGYQRLAITTQLSGDVPAALELLNTAIQEELGLIRQHPDSAVYRRALGLMLSQLAAWREAMDRAGAIGGYRAALQALRAVRQTESRQTVLAMIHAWILMRYAVALNREGQEAEARTAVGESKRIFEELIAAPKAGFMEYNDYASELMRCPFADVCDVRRALELAETAVRLTNRKSPYALDTLAHAYFRNKRVGEAIVTGRAALALAGNVSPAARQEIERGVRLFESNR
jgi:tetratricopeptide (TPR) repeat protein